MADLSYIPLQEIEDLVTCRLLKEKYVKEQNFDDAAKMRDLEKIIMNKNPYLPYLSTNEMLTYLREKRINHIIE